MRIIHDLGEMTETARGWLAGGAVGFVPTKGGLHEGHLALVQAAQQECETSVISILFAGDEKKFVDSTQLEASEELASYPHDLDRDLQLLSTTQVDVVFIPRVEDIFPANFSTYVTLSGSIVERLSSVGMVLFAGMERKIEPGEKKESREGEIAPEFQRYMREVATTMTKLLQLVRPDVVYFGQENAQQVAIVREIVRDLNIDVTLRTLPIVRESDGLAKSSRNSLLSSSERQAASVVNRALHVGKVLIDGGERRPALIEKAMIEVVASEPLVTLDYVSVCHSDDVNDWGRFPLLAEITPKTMLALAIRVVCGRGEQTGYVRLIDNIVWLGDNEWIV